MTPRDAAFAGLGALAFPLGMLAAHIIAHRSPLYPHAKEK